MSNNPFTLTFGKKPDEYISRYENSEMIRNAFESSNPVSQTYMIQGIRGSGKTVLMTSIANELSNNKDFIVVDLNSTQDLINDLAMRINNSNKHKNGLIEKGFNISVAGFGVGVGSSSNTYESISTIENYLESLKKKGKKLLITIDEVMHDENMRHFASEFQLLLRKDYPVFLLMTGLYEQVNAIQNDPALTFLLRTPKLDLKPLSLHQITKQYAEIFNLDLENAKNLAQITKGYAFAFQAFGMLYYEYRNTLTLEDILSKLDDMLDDFVYRKIWEGLSTQDKNVLKAIDTDQMKVKDLCEKISMTSSTFSKYRERLIKSGILYSPSHGYVSITLPRFSNIVSSYD